MRERFCPFLREMDVFFNSFVDIFKHLVDPHGQDTVTKLFESIARDNTVRTHLPKYAAEHGFPTKFRTLTTFSRAPTDACKRNTAVAAIAENKESAEVGNSSGNGVNETSTAAANLNMHEPRTTDHAHLNTTDPLELYLAAA